MKTCYRIARATILPRDGIADFMCRTPLVVVGHLAVIDIFKDHRDVRDQGFGNS